MASLLQQIAHQTNSYSVNDAFINSTGLVSPICGDTLPSVAQVPRNAKLVNGLWFASLILSLSGASMCITIQQWLREFLAMADEGALLRLRIRYFREPGLSKWKVYDIAAVLPLLLQISFALFFIGLCYFTADVNESIGHVTLPLVSAWAFLFVLFLSLPAVDPTCPYKVPFLKAALVSLPIQILSYV